MLNGKLGLLPSPGDPPYLSSPLVVGAKSANFRKIMEIFAGPDHSMAVTYDVPPEFHDDPSKFVGGNIFTFGMDRLGVSNSKTGSWPGKD